MLKSTHLVAWGMLLILSLVWGSSFILIKRGLDVFPAGQVGALRILAASLFLFPFAVSRLRALKQKHWVMLFSVGMFGSFLPAFLFAQAQTNLPSSVAGILNALTPLFTMIIGALFFTQRIKPATALGLAVGFFGTLLLIATGGEGGYASLNYYAFYVVLATVFYGANLNLIKYKIPDLKALTITAVSLLIVGPVAAVYLFGYTDFVYRVQYVDNAIWSLGAVVLLGVMGTALALIMFNHLVKITTPIFTSSVTYIIPIVAVMWGVLDGERLLLGHFAGMALVILGVYLANRSKAK